MNILAKIFPFLIAFITTSIVITPPAQAKRRCGKTFKIKRIAGSKSLKRAKKIARIKSARAAKKRCGIHRRLIRLNKKWHQTCVRKGKLHRCSATGTYRCCKGKKRNKKFNKLPKNIKKHQKHQKHHLTIARRHHHKVIRKAKHHKRKHSALCFRPVVVKAIAKSQKKAVAKKRARQKVYKRAKSRCQSRAVRYVSKWVYRCHKKGKLHACTATNKMRCCHHSRRHHKRKHKRRHKKKKHHKHTH